MADRERFVPQRVHEVVDGLVADAPIGGPPVTEDELRAFARLVTAIFHYEMHAQEQALIEAWHRPGAGDQIHAELGGLLRDANYTDVSVAELDQAIEQESLVPLRLEIDLDDYEDLTVARRGSRRETIEVTKWRGLRTTEHTMTVDEEVIIHSLVKPASWFEARGIDPADRNLRPGHRSLKQFQNVPRADIEMLLPSVKVRFRTIDALVVGVPALVSGIAVLVTKLLPTIGLMVLLVGAGLGLREDSPTLDQTALVVMIGGLITLGGFFARQWSKLKNRRVEYLKTLSENLYFRTVGDGPGVIHALLAAAEQQEVIEVLLAYRFLLTDPDGATAAELDAQVETWLGRDGLDIDFDVDDAIDKLAEVDLVRPGAHDQPDARVPVRPMDEALRVLDQRWDAVFDHR